MIDFKIFGIDFRVSVGFIGVLCLMLYIDRAGLMLPTAISVMLHEFGHLIALMLLKSRPKRVELKVGAVGIEGNFVLSRKNEAVMLAAGSVLNVILFLALYFSYSFCGLKYLLDFSLVTLVVGVFNLLPVMGLDGGSILNIILSKFLKQKTSNVIVVTVSLVTVSLIILLGIYVFKDTKSNISLILLGLYLFLGILLSKKQKNDCKIYKNIVK